MESTDKTLKQQEIGRLIAADKVQGTPVAHAVMSFGGILGMGKHRYPLPWEVLEYDTNLDSYVVDIDAETLNGAPVYDEGATSWGDETWRRSVNDYYKVAPF